MAQRGRNGHPTTVPDERDSHAMAYDLTRGRTVMFGGWDFNFAMLGETWEWDGVDWVDAMPANSPSARLWPAMAFDTANNVIVLFGGEVGGAEVDDTWHYDGIDWVQAQPASSPSPRSRHAMAYDISRGRTVLFAGATPGLVADTWEYDGSNWLQVNTDGAPSARADAQLVFDAAQARSVLFGGSDANVDLQDTWEWDGRFWREVITATQPPTNTAMGAAFDINRGRTVVFGGFDGTAAVGDTWEFGGNDATWRMFGTGCDGSNGLPPRLAAGNLPTIGSTADFDVVDLPAAGGAVVIALGFSDAQWNGMSLPVDLGTFGLTGCRGYTSSDASQLLVHQAGTATWQLAIPNSPTLSGLDLFIQALSLDIAVTSRPFPGRDIACDRNERPLVCPMAGEWSQPCRLCSDEKIA